MPEETLLHRADKRRFASSDRIAPHDSGRYEPDHAPTLPLAGIPSHPTRHGYLPETVGSSPICRTTRLPLRSRCRGCARTRRNRRAERRSLGQAVFACRRSWFYLYRHYSAVPITATRAQRKLQDRRSGPRRPLTTTAFESQDSASLDRHSLKDSAPSRRISDRSIISTRHSFLEQWEAKARARQSCIWLLRRVRW